MQQQNTTMRIRYLSDLHTEFYDLLALNRLLMRIKPSKDEVCVCAGDIGSIVHSRKNYDITLSYLSKQFKQVFVINGNHEYYNGDNKTMEQVNALMKTYFEEKSFANVQWLNNTTYKYEDVTFIGTTLWTHVQPETPEINDTRYIPGLTRDIYNNNHQVCKEWLRSLIPLPSKSVIITHHMPSPQLVAPKYRDAKINSWFHCNMEKFIENNKNSIACWIYGHTHTASEQHISGVPMLCNPHGYPGENVWTETKIDIY